MTDPSSGASNGEDGTDRETGSDDVEPTGGANAGENDVGPDGNAIGDPPDDPDESDEGGISRRTLLGTGLAAAVGIGLAGYWAEEELLGDGEPARNTIWERTRTALRESPDHLPGTADRLVADGDPAAIFEFVRDDVATRPPRIRDNSDFTTAVDGGSRAALRSGVGTAREKAELLADLLGRAGYEAGVKRYARGLDDARKKELYFGGTDPPFQPGADLDQVRSWREQLGGDATVDGKPILDEGGTESAALGDRLRSAHPDLVPEGGGTGFDYGKGANNVPVVAFREATNGGDTTNEGGSPDTATGSNADLNGPDVRYADLFHADESFGSLTVPDKVEAIDPPDDTTVAVTLETATADAPGERTELVSGLWKARQLAGRQLLVDAHPGIHPLHYPNVRFKDVRRFVPALAVQDPHGSRAQRERLSALGDPFSLTGHRVGVQYDGTLSLDGTRLREGEDDPTIRLETPDGTRRTVTPIESDGAASAYYSYDDENEVSSNTPDGLEREDATVTFLHRNTETGALSLVVLNDVAGSDSGGRTAMTFAGVNGYRWLETDDPMKKSTDYYGDPRSILGATETALWRWDSPNTDGGVIGTLGGAFDVSMTHLETGHVQGETLSRDGIDRWVFVDGEDLDSPVELAAFGSDGGDATARVFVEEGSGATGPPSVPDDVADVAELDVSADASEFPTVRVAVRAVTGDGDAVAGLPGGAFEITEDDASVVADQTGVDPYAFEYRAEAADAGTERTVTVRVPEGDVERSVSYQVPEDPTDPRVDRGLSGLYLRLEVGDRTVRRTLAGWDPQIDGDRDPTPADHREVVSALFGQHVLHFESAGVPVSVHLDDHLAGKQTLAPIDAASESGDSEARDAAMREGIAATTGAPSHFHPRLPDRMADDTLTYGTGLRGILYGQRLDPEAGVVAHSVDILPTSTIRTITRDGDAERAFRLTMDRTARLAVLERELFETSTASLLSDADLVPVSEIGGSWSDSTRVRYDAAVDRRDEHGSDFHLSGAGGSTAAFWNVDAQTGAVTGVLPDGSGGAAESIKETIEEVSRLIDLWNKIASNAPKGMIGSAASYFSTLMKLYGAVTVAIATMTIEELPDAQKRAISQMVCNVAEKMSWSYAGVELHVKGEFLNNLHGIDDNSAYDC